MVSREIYSQAVLLASCVGLGLWLMFCYDLLRVLRLILPQRPWLISLEDLLYWIYVSLSAFSLLYRQNDGTLRGYVIVGIFAGMISYDRLVSQNVMKVLQKVVESIKIKWNRRRRRQKTVNIKSGDGDENDGTAVPSEEAGQMGQSDSLSGSYPSSGQPGSGGKLKKRIVKRKGLGIPGPGGEPAGSEGGRRKAEG